MPKECERRHPRVHREAPGGSLKRARRGVGAAWVTRDAWATPHSALLAPSLERCAARRAQPVGRERSEAILGGGHRISRRPLSRCRRCAEPTCGSRRATRCHRPAPRRGACRRTCRRRFAGSCRHPAEGHRRRTGTGASPPSGLSAAAGMHVCRSVGLDGAARSHPRDEAAPTSRECPAVT